MMKKACLALAVALACCTHSTADEIERKEADTVYGPGLDITVGGQRYRGRYLFGTRDDHVVYCSGNLLTAWNERHGSVEYSNGRTTFKVGELAITCPPGQPLLLVNSDTRVSFVAYEVPDALKNCRSREAMQKQVKALLESHATSSSPLQEERR